MKKNLHTKLFVFLFVALCNLANSQNINIDSLRNEAYRQDNDTTSRWNAVSKLYLYYAVNNFDSASVYARAMVGLCDTLIYTPRLGTSFMRIGTLYARQGNYSLSDYYYKKVIQATRKVKDYSALASTYSNLGYMNLRSGDYEKARDYLETAIHLFDSLGIKKNEPYLNLGIAYGELDETTKSLEYFYKAKSICEEIGNKKSIAIIDIKIAGEYGKGKDYDKAKEMLLDAINMAKEVNRNEELGLAYGNIAIIYASTDEDDKARAYYDSCYSTFREGNMLNNIKIANVNRAEFFLKNGEYEAMKQSIDEGLSISVQDADSMSIAGYKLLQARYYIKKGLYKEALQLCNESKEIYIAKHCVGIEIKEMQETLYQSYKGVGLSGKALTALEAFTNYRDSTYNAEKLKKLTLLEGKYKFEKERKIIELENEQQEEKFKMLILSISIVLFFSLAFLGFLIRWNIQRKKMNRKLEENRNLIQKQNDELGVQLDTIRKSEAEKELLLKEIHHRVKNNLQVVSSLLELQVLRGQTTDIKDIMSESRNRVHAMGLIHQLLYQAEDIRVVDLEEFAQKLVNELSQIYGISIRKEIFFECKYFDIDTSIPLGLMLNELISNSLKYAKPEGGDLEVSIKLSANINNSGSYVLTVRDNGPGLKDDFDLNRTNSLGLFLIKSLSRQLMGNCAYTYEKGACFTITFNQKRTG